MGNALKDIIAATYTKMAEVDTSTEYNRDIVVNKINTIYKDVCRWEVQRLFPAPGSPVNGAIVAKRLPFLEQKKPINWEGTSKLDQSASIWAIELFLDTTNLEANWAVYIRGNLIKYTWKTSTSITGVTWVIIALDQWDIVSPLFKTSWINLYKPFDLVKQVWDQELSMVYIDEWMYVPGSYYKTLNDGEDKYIYIVNFNTWLYWLKYIYEPDDLEDEDDEVLLDGNNWIEIISSIVAWELLFDTEETMFAQEKLTLWYNALIKFFNRFNSDKKNQTKSIDYSFCTGWEITRWYFNNN